MIALTKLTIAERIESGRGVVAGKLASLDGVIYERRSNAEWRRVKDQAGGLLRFERASAGRRPAAWPSRKQLQVALLLVIRVMGGRVVLKDQQEQMLNALAEHFRLDEARRRLPHPTAGTQWANIVHWARLGLLQEAKLDREAPHGTWALAPEPGTETPENPARGRKIQRSVGGAP